jgi:hypothetical protein
VSRRVLPASRVGWWTVGLAWAVVVVGLLLPSMTSWFGPLQERLGRRGLPTGSSLVSVEIALAVVTITLAVVALLRKDRAWLLVGSFTVAVLVGGFWMLFVLGEVLSPH